MDIVHSESTQTRSAGGSRAISNEENAVREVGSTYK